MARPDLAELSVTGFLDRLASASPAPGGGSVAALVAALAGALISMVCNLTAGRERFADVEREVRAILQGAESIRQQMQTAIQADADAYETVIAAFRLPRGTGAQKTARAEAIQSASAQAARVPIEVAEACAAVIGLCERAVLITNPNAVSDISVAVLLAGAGADAAAANVEINLVSISDEQLVADLRQRLVSETTGLAPRVAKVVAQAHERMRG